ncbi:uncharacterized protein LOC117577624 [Drosophila albomicans]|uniref:Uncharacterized protein LOC117577624 n=1 Tax=Drosophila albomicans TaxID=7291 RepID=A0A6P8XP34_DROAB|nr:uncharacterized protein LOC117577624 [Drosophila albomicans]
MSYSNLYSSTVDGCQRVSYCRNPSLDRFWERERGGECRSARDNATGDGLIICKDLIIGCKPESTDDFRPFIFEPTWCVYIKAQDRVDMGHYVKRVTFRMSPRLPLRLHVADSSPFEITEVLSTDFPLELQVDYIDSSMTPTTYVYKPNDVFDGTYNVELRMNFQGHQRKDKMFFMSPPLAMQLSLSTLAPLSGVAKPKFLTASVKSVSLPRTEKQEQPQPQPMESNGTEEEEEELTAGLPLALPSVPRPIFNVRRGSLFELTSQQSQL